MDTICAIATPSGGALGIVRVSGPQAISATSEIFKPKGSMPLDQRHGGTITFGNIINPDTDELIDEVLISLFRSPHSQQRHPLFTIKTLIIHYQNIYY